jgi:hypothetical protein
MTSPDPRALVDELTADLEPADAAALTVELLRMIDLGLLELDEGAGEAGVLRIGIADGLDDDADSLVA